jgi:hypothetical protein
MGKGNGDNGHGTFRFWAEHERKTKDQEDEPVVMQEYHLDCQGKKRLFRLSEISRGPLSFIYAVELRDGEPTGLSLRAHYDEMTEMPAWWDIRRKIAKRLATRDVVRDPDTGNLEILNMLIRARVGAQGKDGPEMLVDDLAITWEELGKVLQTYEGWSVKIKISDD